MIKNYFRVAFRNIKRHKSFSFINVAGLAVGMACTILIGTYVYHELSYDRFNEKAGQIYRVGAQYTVRPFTIAVPTQLLPWPRPSFLTLLSVTTDPNSCLKPE